MNTHYDLPIPLCIFLFKLEHQNKGLKIERLTYKMKIPRYGKSSFYDLGAAGEVFGHLMAHGKYVAIQQLLAWVFIPSKKYSLQLLGYLYCTSSVNDIT